MNDFSRRLFGRARDLRDPSIFHHLSLVAFLAWVGLGADGLSSSAYGPEAAFSAIGEHRSIRRMNAVWCLAGRSGRSARGGAVHGPGPGSPAARRLSG